MLNYYYSDSITEFQLKAKETIIGEISINGRLGHISTQLNAWENQIEILKDSLQNLSGNIFFEFSIPRMGKRVDCILIIKNVVFVVEFKIGEKEYNQSDSDQVWDYALDLKNFHKSSFDKIMVPILVASKAKDLPIEVVSTSHNDNLFKPIKTNSNDLKKVINNVINFFDNSTKIDSVEFINGVYSPTPTIIEAAVKLYSNHNVDDITRNDADAINLKITTEYVSKTIDYAKENGKKIICFVTGVPGAGKTLVGLKIAAEHLDKNKGNSSVFLSGNKPLVDILQEALTRDKVAQERKKGIKITKQFARDSVKSFIQIIHHYRDAYLVDQSAPFDHVAIFDEAQRAWNKEQTVKFMAEKKGKSNFPYSEPEYLISCLDRHQDWAVIICLVGGGQEINTGEAGISEWLYSIKNQFKHWETRISPNLYESEYNATKIIESLEATNIVEFNKNLHLAVSMRSYRAENMSRFVKELLDFDENASKTLDKLIKNYPIVLTRSVNDARSWLKEKARGNERYGIVVSSQAYRLKPLAMDVRTPINHVNWFLDGKDDIRSSYFLEDVATEFQVQGLELDWVCLTWDGDLRYSDEGWKTYSFKGNKWQMIHKEERKKYLINAYRVLLTRARQGIIIVVPEGNVEDHTRKPEFYNSTFEYLKNIGLSVIENS
jgi:hypothetical protein